MSGNPTPSEQDYSDDKNEENITEHEETQENDHTQADETLNDGEPNEGAQGLPESAEDNDNYLNPGVEAEGAQGLPEPAEDNDNMNPGIEADGAQGLQENQDAEMVQPAQVGADIMAHDPDAGPDLEEELGGVIVEALDYGNGQMEFLVMSIDSTPAPPEL